MSTQATSAVPKGWTAAVLFFNASSDYLETVFDATDAIAVGSRGSPD